MYLRRVRFEDGDHYIIRKSFRDDGCWKFTDLMDLGRDPEAYIEYAGGNGFWFNAAIEEKLQAAGADYCSEDLERLFLPFLDPHIRRIVENFQTHRVVQSSGVRYSNIELLQKQNQLHLFDKHRMHFLRYGRVDIGDLEGRPWKFLNILLEKSRDEIEHTIEGMEGVLRPHEMRSYLFTALHLQSFFPHHILRNHPLALDQEKVDRCFLDAICSLNEDANFFVGVDFHKGSTLHSYLSKYVILFFDSEFGPTGWSEYFDGFQRRDQPYKRIPAVKGMDAKAACKILRITNEDLVKMHRKDLVRMYRKKAKELHPDSGGDKESFIQMTRAFECLLETK